MRNSRCRQNFFENLENQLTKEADADQVYDQVVSLGEVISSVIVHHYLLSKNVASHWIDARNLYSNR